MVSTLELLARNDYLQKSALFLAIAFAIHWVFKKAVKKINRILELDGWIKAARKEREAKPHPVLTRRNTSDAELEAHPLYSADETRELILSNQLDPRLNIEMLAKRCRKYGREKVANAITEEWYEDAYRTACEMMDKKFKPNDDAPALFGVPICIKDCMNVKGACTAGGMACRLNKKDEDDCLTVSLLRDAGAIPLCRGNVMQVMMLAESVNRIWGRTNNPWNMERSPGGSSGGDAALVAMGCVPMSACADGAGSIRIPASFCGVVGFKPTSTRVSFKGCMRPRLNDQQGVGITVPAVMGAMSQNVEDIAMFMKAVLVPKAFEKDLNMPPILFDNKQYDKKGPMKIGYFETDDYFEPCASAKRGLRETIEKLKAAGHTCVPFKPPTDGWFAYRVFVGIMSAEGNMRSFREAVEGEPFVLDYMTILQGAMMPHPAKHLIGAVLGERVKWLFESNQKISVYDLWALIAEMLDMRTLWNNAFQEAGVDAIIHPAMPTPAVRHGMSAQVACISYMLIGPMLLWPAGVLPVTTVREDEQHYYETKELRDQLPKNQRDHLARLAAQEMKDSKGLPINISVLTPSYKDETCLRVMKEVERVVGFKERATAYKAKA